MVTMMYIRIMKRGDAVRKIKAAAKARSLVFTPHARQAMLDDGETVESVSASVERSAMFVPQTDGTWRVGGDDLTIIIAIRAAVVVVTVFI